MLELIANQLINREWWRLGRCLKLSGCVISEIEYKNGGGNLSGRCRDIMMLWKSRERSDALGFNLVKALHKADLRQLADRYIQL